jgi:hypothetical protein
MAQLSYKPPNEPRCPQAHRDARVTGRSVAEKRAAHLDQCGEPVMATTWRRIADAIRTTEARDVAGHSVPAE